MDEDLKRRLDSMEHKLDPTRDLVRIGLNTVTGLDSKVNTLIDSQVRLYDSMQMLSDSMQTLSGSIQRLTDAQAETERKLQRLLDSLRHPDGEHPEN